MNVNKTDTRHNLWHKLLGKVFEELLTPVNITVETSVRIMAESPEAGVLLDPTESARMDRSAARPAA